MNRYHFSFQYQLNATWQLCFILYIFPSVVHPHYRLIKLLFSPTYQDDDANSVVLDEEEEMEEIEYKDEGYLSLVLKLMAGMCDGQFVGLQVSLLSY